MFSRAFSQIGLLLAVFAAVFIVGCGGGSGSPSDRFEARLTESRMSYGPIELEIIGGRAPYIIRTNTSAIELPRETNSKTVYGFVYPVIDDGVGVVFVEDRNHREVSVSFEHVAATFEPPTLTVTATSNTGCTTGTGGDYTQICAGSPGIAELLLNAPGGVLANEPVQFNVLQGNYQIRADDSSAWGTSVVMRTDSAGKAQVAIQTTPGVSTHTATIGARADGLTLNTSFTIVGANFQMLPTSASWTSAGTTCPSRTASFSLYGGTPPYSLQTTLGTLSTSSVAAIGGSVTLTVAVCGTGQLTARDAVGSTITAAISYTASTTTEPEPEPPVVASSLTPPSWGTSTARVTCDASTVFGLSVTGGTPPYSVTVLPMGSVATATMIAATLWQVEFSAAPALGSNFSIYVVDSKGQTATAPRLYCIGA
ncbi:MAG: hypothetical protein LBE32_07290 [Burkholderiales bacterium]|nr:hypothetical protein [Burkholderiales bacterium]